VSGHTPGPWRWEFNKQAKSVYLVGGAPRDDMTVMQFARWGMGHAVPLFNLAINGNLYDIMDRLCDRPKWTKPFPGADWRMDVVHPDARLIAAAPDLLEFAEEVRRTGDTRLASIAIAIISKATGGAA